MLAPSGDGGQPKLDSCIPRGERPRFPRYGAPAYDRKLVYIATAVLLLAVVFVLSTQERGAERSPRARAPAADGAVAIQSRAPPVVPSDATEAHRDPKQRRRPPQSTPRTGTRERERQIAPKVIPRDARAATAAARAFLRGYLAYGYGHATANDLRAASVALARAHGCSAARPSNRGQG